MRGQAPSGWIDSLKILTEAVCVAAVLAASVTASAADAPAGRAVSAPEGAGQPSADPVAICLDAHGRSQELRQSGLLLEAREMLLNCAQFACPQLVRADCLRWQDELRRQLPSVALRVTVDGKMETQVAVSLDGKPLFSEVPTKAIELNPGKHVFRFERQGFSAIEREFVVGEGEKYSALDVAFETPGAAEPKASDSPPRGLLFDARRGTPTTDQRTRPIPWPVYALAGLGVVGAAGFAGFGLATRSLEQDKQDECEPRCTPSDVDDVKQRALFADLSLAVGAAALMAAGTYYFFRPYERVEAGALVSPSTGAQARVRVVF